jgi:hypothetical protein
MTESRRPAWTAFLIVVTVAAAALLRAQGGPAPQTTAAAQFAPAQRTPPAPRAVQASPPTQNGPARKLPVARVVLFKNGVGFFEHVGRVRGVETVTIDFTSGQLNDVLKSLTTLDLGNGRVTGVSYNSEAPLSRRLEALRLPLDENTTLTQFLGALRGARLEARGPTGPVMGRLLSVERKTVTDGQRSTDVDLLSLVSDAGDVQTLELRPGANVRIVERDLNLEVGRYLNLVASARDRDVRRMSISTSGTGERQLYISYISEVPIWKTTYRIVLPSNAQAKSMIQGWAIVDNTIGEDWNNVELSLVAGAPQSFIQQLSQPYYGRRPVVALPQSAQLEPQTHQGTLKTEDGTPAPPPPPPPSTRNTLDFVTALPGRGRGGGGGIAGGAVGGVVGGAVGGIAESVTVTDIAAARQASVAAAEGRELADLFEYKLKERVTIRKDQSALVPILQAPIDVEKVSLWNESTGARPLRALWITNTTNLTLDGGTFSVLEDETFNGEGLVAALKPGEKRLLSYAADLAMTVDTRRDSERQQATDVRILRGVMLYQVQERERRTYTVRNEDASARTLIIEHPVRFGWNLTGAVTPAESSAGFYRFRLPVQPHSTATLTVEEMRPVESRYSVSNLTRDQVALFLKQQVINPQIDQALQPVFGKKDEIAALDTEIAARKAEVERIFQDQERLRENLKALKGSAAEKNLVERYTKQLDEQETRLATLRRETAEREGKRHDAQAALDKLIEGLAVGVKS